MTTTGVANEPVGDLDYYSRAFRRGWRAILLGALIGVLLGVAYFVLMPKTYSSTASVLVYDIEGLSTSAVGERTPSGSVNLDTEAQLITSADVLDGVLDETGDAFDADTLSDMVSVSVPPNTTVLAITFAADTPARAQQGASAFAKAYLDNRSENARSVIDTQVDNYNESVSTVQAEIRRLSRSLAGEQPGSAAYLTIQSQIQVQTSQLSTLRQNIDAVRGTAINPGRVIKQAAEPSRPTSPNRQVALASGFALGLLGGLAVAMFRERFRSRISTASDVERELLVPMLASVPVDPDVPVAAPRSIAGLAYAQLRRRITQEIPDSRSLALSSPHSEQAASVTATNLAWQYAAAGTEVRILMHGLPDLEGMRQANRLEGLAAQRWEGTGPLKTKAPVYLVDTSEIGSTELDDWAGWNTPYATNLLVTSPLSNPEMFDPSRCRFAVLVLDPQQGRANTVREATQVLDATGVSLLGAVLQREPEHRERRSLIRRRKHGSHQ